MPTTFQLGCPLHLLILGAVPALAGLLAQWARRRPGTAPWIGRGLGIAIAVNELVWYRHAFERGYVGFPGMLPLDLCDVVLWLTVFTLFTLNARTFETAYYWGLAGTGMAVLTPDIAGPFPSYDSIKFFLAHGGVVTSILFLIWSRQARPRPGSVLRAFALLNGYAFVMAVFNTVFETNYLYLCGKPGAPSILDWLGPWPWYLLFVEGLGLALFCLLWLPFSPARRFRGRQTLIQNGRP